MPARRGEIGTIIQLAPNITFEDRFQSYVVQFDTASGRVTEHYLQYESDVGALARVKSRRPRFDPVVQVSAPHRPGCSNW